MTDGDLEVAPIMTDGDLEVAPIMTDEERHELADRLNDAWAMLRRVPGGSEGLADVCLEAAQFIRPADSNASRGESESGRS